MRFINALANTILASKSSWHFYSTGLTNSSSSAANIMLTQTGHIFTEYDMPL